MVYFLGVFHNLDFQVRRHFHAPFRKHLLRALQESFLQIRVRPRVGHQHFPLQGPFVLLRHEVSPPSWVSDLLRANPETQKHREKGNFIATRQVPPGPTPNDLLSDSWQWGVSPLHPTL